MAKKSLNPGMIMVISFGVLFAVNALVILLVNALLPFDVVLGTIHISKFWAVILSMGALALIDTFAIPFANQYETNRGKILTSKDWMVIYFGVNFVGLWLITRAAEVLGLGISSFWMAILLAVVLDLVQGMAMMKLEEFRKKN